MLNTQRLFKCLFIILMILMCCSVSYGSMAQEENSIENVKLPPNWTVQKIAEAPKETLIGLSQKLGGELVSAKNYLIDVKGVMLKIGVAECKTGVIVKCCGLSVSFSSKVSSLFGQNMDMDKAH
jgi:hypothetical protein